MSEIRKFIPVLSEYKQAVAIEHANFPDEEISIESWKWYDQHLDPNTVFSRWVGEMDGKIISHGLFTQVPNQENLKHNHFILHIAVHPDMQCKGYGSELFVHLHRHLQQYIPCSIEAIVREDKPQSLHFLEHRHFKVKSTKAIARLNIPANCKLLDLTGSSGHLAALGIRIDPLSELIDSDRDWVKNIYNQSKAIILEMNNTDEGFPSLQDFQQQFIQDRTFNPQHFFVARYHEHWIGLSGIRQSEKIKHTCVHTFTGVNRPYRRNGIASTLIQHCINAAIQSGYTAIESHAPQDNPMSDLHKKLGYKVLPSNHTYELSLV
jgi:ribosomal protein S18 acetylase RimI-like enzyme